MLSTQLCSSGCPAFDLWAFVVGAFIRSHAPNAVMVLSAGHLWLQSQLGRETVVPTTGWHIDPFGYIPVLAVSNHVPAGPVPHVAAPGIDTARPCVCVSERETGRGGGGGKRERQGTDMVCTDACFAPPPFLWRAC